MINSEQKNAVLYEQNAAYYWLCLKKGLARIFHQPKYRVVAALYWAAAALLIIKCALPPENRLDKLLQPLALFGLVLCSVLIFLFAVTICAIPAGSHRFANAFRAINLVNSAGQPPLMLSKERRGDNMLVEILCLGITEEELQKRQLEIEAALNMKVAAIKEGADCQHIILCLAPGTAKLPERVCLPKTDKAADNPKLVLGQSLFEEVVVNLDSTPHILVGGSTGSGKTTMLKVLIQQALQKGWQVDLIDMKAGQDYSPSWQQICNLCDNAQYALTVLSGVVQELERCKDLFGQISRRLNVECSSIADFNKLRPENPLRRRLIVIDELAELTDTTGLDKNNKELAAKIVKQLATIARLGRAYGINLVFGVQRGDANVIPGQIKSNISYRVSSKADATLSMIILDNTSANEMIPKDSRGRFINHDGVVFQGYILE